MIPGLQPRAQKNRGQNYMRNRGQNTDSAKILEHIIYGLFFLYTWAPWLTRTYLSFAHTLDFVFEVLSAQHQFLIQQRSQACINAFREIEGAISKEKLNSLPTATTPTQHTNYPSLLTNKE
jgi:hypothetical protein